MGDDRKPSRAMTSDDRALAGRDRRRSDALGVPVVEVSDELTPPPQEPPPRDYDSVPPPIRAVLEAQDATQRELVEAVGKVWQLRHVGELIADRLDRFEFNLAAIAKSTTVHETILAELKPQLDRWRAATDGLSQQLPKLIGSLEGLTLHVQTVDSRMRHVELEVRVLGERSNGHADALEVRERWHDALVKRVHALEQIESNRAATTQALAETERKKSRTAGGAAGGVIGAVIAAVIAALR